MTKRFLLIYTIVGLVGAVGIGMLFTADVSAAPVASFTFAPTSPAVGQNVTFDGSASTAGAGHSIVSYVWSFGDQTTGTGVTVAHAYASANTYMVKVTVTDDVGQTTISKGQNVIVGSGTPPPPPPPPAATIQSNELTAKIRGNEGTEYLNGASSTTIAKAMPGATINGVDDLFHVALPTTTLVLRGLNAEHLIAGHDTVNDAFTLRLAHMPVEVIDAHTVRMCEVDPYWKAHLCITLTAGEPHNLDYTVTVWFEDVSLFAPQGHVTLMFANYVPFTTDVGLYLRGIPSAGAAETWLRWWPTLPGGSIMAPQATARVVDPAQSQNWGYAIDYKGNLKSFPYPRYTQPFYCGIQTATNTIYQMMFDRSWSQTDEMQITAFGFKTKMDAAGNTTGTPAWDFQYVVHAPMAGQVYGFRSRLSARPRLASGSIEGECVNEYTAYQAEIAGTTWP